MKKTTSSLFAILLFFMIYSCKKSDNNGNPVSSTTNGFNFKNLFYPTELSGIIKMNGTYTLVFYSRSMSFDTANHLWKGTGNGVAFGDLLCDKPDNGYPTGDFYASDSSQNGFFTDVSSIIKYNFDVDTGMEKACSNGHLHIVRNGSQFQISYSLVNTDSTTETGKFTGPLPDISNWFNYSLLTNRRFKFGDGEQRTEDR